MCTMCVDFHQHSQEVLNKCNISVFAYAGIHTCLIKIENLQIKYPYLHKLFGPLVENGI